MELKRELEFIVSDPVVVTEHLKELSASLEEGATSRGQVVLGPEKRMR